MRRITYRIIAIMATALLALATSGCVDPLDDSLKPQPEEPTLTFWIRVPGSMVTTKAETGLVDGIQYESTLHDVQVWVFPHGVTDANAASTLPLNYVEKDLGDSDQWDTHTTTSDETLDTKWGNAYKIQVPVPKEFVLASDPRVDIYVLANWRSIYSTTNKPADGLSLAQVRDLVFGASTLDTYFGTGNPTTAVPAKGLPISAIYMGEDGDDDDTEPDGVSLQFLQDAYNGIGEPLTNDLFKREIGVIELERAVSKIRFVFSRPTGMEGVQISKVEIDKDLIPNSTYAFPNTRSNFYPANTTFGGETTLSGTGTNPLLADNAIGDCIDPYVLTNIWFEANYNTTSYPNTPQGYHDYLTAAINHKEEGVAKPQATEKLIYFRESDKAISGKIYYRKSSGDTEDQVVTFTMTLPDVDDGYNNFHRNHYWTVYVYFLGGDLYVLPTVADWTDADPLSYNINLNTNMRLFDSWLYRYDTDQDYTQYWKWQTSHMVVSDGLQVAGVTGDVENRPLRSPQIQLVTTGTGAFHLVLDNENFQFVKSVKESGITTSCQIVDQLDIAANGTDVYTYFYIIPKPGVDWTAEGVNRAAHVKLLYDDPVLGTYKVTFNYSALPGYSDDSSEIWVYYFPADEYNNTAGDKLKMYFKDTANPLVPTTDQS